MREPPRRARAARCRRRTPAIAATGATRVARSAGTSAASRVVADPHRQRDDDRPRREHQAGARDPEAGGVEERVEQLREPDPGERARAARRPTPISSASTATGARIWPRVAPSARSIANSRVRWATVIEKVLKMMKAPTSTAAPASASSAGVRNEPIWSLISSAASSAFSLGGLRPSRSRQRPPSIRPARAVGVDASRRRSR